MKIAFVFPPMWPVHGDGSLQIWNEEVTTRLAKSHDVLVYSGLHSFKRREDRNGVRYRRFSTRADAFLKEAYYRLLRHFPRIRGAVDARRPLFSSDLWYLTYAVRVAFDLRRRNCTVVHVYNYPHFAYLIKRLNPTVRVVLNMHGEWLTRIKFNNLDARLNRIDVVITCSDFCTRMVRDRFPEMASRTWTVPMGLSPHTLSNDKDSYCPHDSRPMQLLYVGRISPEKGLHVLLDAFELILQKRPDATLVIVGPESVAPRDTIVDLCLEKSLADSIAPFYAGSYLSQLRQRLSPAAAKRVTFTGPISHKDVAKYYANADVYVSPSLYESFGMAIIEAMAAGVPVVAARGGAVPDVVSDGRTGILVDVADPAGIANAVSTLSSDSEFRASMTVAARKKVCKEFSWETVVNSLIRVYGNQHSDRASVPIEVGNAAKEDSATEPLAATQNARN